MIDGSTVALAEHVRADEVAARAEELLGVVWQRGRSARHRPIATYRLQMNRGFTFSDARHLVSYLHALGISHCYASPYFRAREESTHGYDIADHNALNPAIGAAAQYQAWVDAMHAHGMGQVLDTVPNHMGIGEENNRWWMDVLENGPSSLYATFFDIDWRPATGGLDHQVLLPILGDYYGHVLENQELKLAYAQGQFSIHYYGTRLPLGPRTYGLALRPVLDRLQDRLRPDNEYLMELQSILTALTYLPGRTETDPARTEERRRESRIIKGRFARLHEHSPAVRRSLAAVIKEFNGRAGDPHSFDQLDALIRAQPYRLSYWRVAGEEINYRRFFDINDLAAIRMELPEVFAETHRLILRLLTDGAVDALRIDHPDGLADPADYFWRLQKAFVLEQCRRLFQSEDASPAGSHASGEDGASSEDQGEAEEADPAEAWSLIEERVVERLETLRYENPQAPQLRALPLFVEKILARGEKLPPDWTVEGTSGYDFMNLVNGLFVDSSNEEPFTELYHRFIEREFDFDEIVYDRKKATMGGSLAGEVNVLAHRLYALGENSRYYRDFTQRDLNRAIREVIACFPVYRTYITGREEKISDHDRDAIETAVTCAQKRNPGTERATYDFVRNMLLLQYPGDFNAEDRVEQVAWVIEFQQVTGPVMAKGLEDTAFYVYNRLVSLNEVGGEPQHFGVSIDSFHDGNQERLRDWPNTMLATSTHDTKRSEDVRARINVLSEAPHEWERRINHWTRLNIDKKVSIDSILAPDRNEEYLIYQTLVGSWPITRMDAAERQSYAERIVAYMRKALNEAKVHTSWLSPNREYEQAVESFIRAILEPSDDNAFLADFEEWSGRIIEGGMLNSLAQTLLKLTCPGVPDIYQGNEMWDFSLVDPDNRRPVDYATRADALEALRARLDEPDATPVDLVAELIESRTDGRIKLYVTQRALQFRGLNAELFARGDYIPLETPGVEKEHICAFMRSHEQVDAIVVVPRLLTRRNGGRSVSLASTGAVWEGSGIVLGPPRGQGQAGASYRNVLTGERITAMEHGGTLVLPLGELFRTLPLALLEQVEEGDA